VTGKGDRWGRDRIGRSAPAFLSASTLHSPHLPARREVQDVVGSCCLLQGRPTVGRLFLEACARRRVSRLLYLPAVPVQQAFCCLPPFACHAHCPHHKFLPPFSLLSPSSHSIHLLLFASPVHCHVRQDRLGPAVCLQPCHTNMFASCKTAP